MIGTRFSGRMYVKKAYSPNFEILAHTILASSAADGMGKSERGVVTLVYHGSQGAGMARPTARPEFGDPSTSKT